MQIAGPIAITKVATASSPSGGSTSVQPQTIGGPKRLPTVPGAIGESPVPSPVASANTTWSSRVGRADSADFALREEVWDSSEGSFFGTCSIPGGHV